MSNGGKGMDMNALMKQAQKLQGDVARVQEEIAQLTCDGASGGGMVTATVNGQMEVVRVKIDKAVVDPNDIGMLEDLVTAAVNAAGTKMRELSKQKMQGVMGGLGGMPGMPGVFRVLDVVRHRRLTRSGASSFSCPDFRVSARSPRHGSRFTSSAATRSKSVTSLRRCWTPPIGSGCARRA